MGLKVHSNTIKKNSFGSFLFRMVNARSGQWYLYVLICALILRKTGGSYIGITYVENAVEKGAVCLDGSPSAYHIDRGFGAGINNWLVHIQGGQWCYDVATCLVRRNTKLGSSKLMEKQIYFSGILSNQPQFNPDFYNWNRVKVRYCDGSSFTGDIEAVDPATGLYFRGARIFLAVVEDLLAKGMKDAENVLLSGSSAGGLASMLHCDRFQALLPMGTKVKCLSDGGYFVNMKDISGAPTIEVMFHEVVMTHGSAKNLPASCTSKMRPSLCFFAPNLVNQIQTPLFIVNAGYDVRQINRVLVPDAADPFSLWQNCKFNIKNCSPSQLRIIQDFWLEFLSMLPELGISTSRGMFINSCFVHCQTEIQELWLTNDSPRLCNKTISEAVGEWYHDRSQFQKIDSPFPYDKTCPNIVYNLQHHSSA